MPLEVLVHTLPHLKVLSQALLKIAILLYVEAFVKAEVASTLVRIMYVQMLALASRMISSLRRVSFDKSPL